MKNNDAQFLKDEELHELLDQWSVPDAPESLDKRVSAAYNKMREAAAARLNPAVPAQTGNEVGTMKVCSKCNEEFADRFSFCPVDGAPLTAVTASAPAEAAIPEIETSYPVAETVAYRQSAETAFDAASASSASGAMIGEFHLTILEDAGLVSRLGKALGGVAEDYRLTWPEFKRDPFGFVGRSIRGYGQMAGDFFRSRDVMVAMLISFVGLIALVAIIVILDRAQSARASRAGLAVFGVLAFCGLVGIFATMLSRDRGAAVMGASASDSRNVMSGIVAAFVIVFGSVGGYFGYQWWHTHRAEMAQAEQDELVVQNMIDIPNEQPTPDEGTAGMAKGTGGGSKAKQEKAAGGGGGGREQQAPASFGKLPPADLHIPVVLPPNPDPPPIKNPVLPVTAQVDADSVLFPTDQRQLNYGDPKSKSTVTSSGPGTGGGIGTGTGGGVGPGSGGGVGPGEGGNTGGGSRNEGGGGPGGGGGGTDYNRVFNGKEVSQKARILEKPEPTYTEEARKNQVTGTVVLRAVFSSNGQITGITPVTRLPDGLTERAIAAAKRIKFLPAMKDGRAVSMYFQLEYNFNLY